MKSKFKSQWTQVIAIIAAAACVVTGTVAGVNGAFAPISASALSVGDTLTLKKVKNDTDSDYHYEITNSITSADVGKEVTVTFNASKYANQTFQGMIGYADSTNGYEWTEEKLEIDIPSDGIFTYEFEIVAGMVGQTIQIQCWYPTVANLTSCSAAVTDGGSSDSGVTTTQVTTVPLGDGTEVEFTTDTQTGTDNDIQAVAEFKSGDASYAVIVYKVSSKDTTSSAGVGTWIGEWVQEEYEQEVDENGLVTITYQIPEDAGTTVKAMVFYPSSDFIEFQSITLYGSQSDIASTTTVTTKKSDDPADLVYKTYNNGDNKNIDLTYMCYMVATFKSPVSGVCYYNNLAQSWEAVDDDGDGYYVAEVALDTANKGDDIMNLYINSSSGSSVQGNLTFYYPGDASLNGVVNGSDIRAIAKYLKSGETKDIMDSVCDYGRDGTASLADAVALTKALVGISGNTSVPGSGK